MKINRIQFAKMMSKYELLKMRAAYIMAERYLMEEEAAAEPPQGPVMDEWVITSSASPEDFHYQRPRRMSEKELVHEKLLVLEHRLKEAEANEQYESCEALMQAIKVLRRRFTNLD